MPFTLSALVAGHPHRFPSRSPTSPRTHQKLYFPPGGHTHDSHTIPPEQLHISLSDPILVAAEQRLSDVPDDQRWSKDGGARKTPKLGSLVFHLNDGILSQWSGDDNIDALQAVNPLTMATNTQATSTEHSWKAGLQGTAGHGLWNPSDDSCDISEVVTIPSAIDGLPGDADSSASENRYTLTVKL